MDDGFYQIPADRSRIKRTGGTTSTADCQLNKVQILGGTTKFIESEIQRLNGMTDAEIWKLYDDVVDQGYTRKKSIYKQVNSSFVPYEENEVLQAWTRAVVSQTRGEIKNITRSLGMMVPVGGKAVFTPLAEYYQKYLDRACMDVVTGSFSYNTVLRRVVKEMAASGIRSVDYASGWSNRVPVTARRAVMTGVHQLSAQINEQVAKDLKTEDYEVTWHSGVRPDHWWGGRVYSYDDLRRVCNLGDVAGLCGANCCHSYYAFVRGVSARTYTDAQLDEMNAREEEQHSYQGKKYNAYEATQRQRQLETRMRAQRSKIKLLKEGRADPEEIMAVQTRYLTTLHKYQGFSEVMELPEQMERVYMDGLGRMNGGRIPVKSIANTRRSDVVKSAGSGIIEMYRKSSDPRKNLKFISDKSFNDLTIAARKKGAVIIRGTKDAEEHLEKMGAAASNLGDVLLFRKNVCISEVLEETYHFEQNIAGMNNDKGEPLRSILNEIDAKKYVLKNALKYKIPRNEIVLTQQQLKSYEKQLAEYESR